MTQIKRSTSIRRLAGLLVVPLLAGCSGPPAGTGAVDDGSTAAPGDDLAETARRLAAETLVVDTHIDVPYRLQEKDADLSQRTADGDFDYPRAMAGGLDVAFMSIYVPASYQESGGAKAFAESLIAMVEGFAERWPDRFALVSSTDEVESSAGQGRVLLAMGMENGAPIEHDLGNVEHFHRRGIRYVTLTHSKNNQICDSSYDEERTWNGLSPFGREVVAEMNRVGVMVDVSHVSDEAFEQVLEVTRAPVIASHSSARHFTPGFERNMSDEMIVALADNGGVLQINFGSAFLTETANRQSMERWQAVERFADEHGVPQDHESVEAFSERYREEHPLTLATVEDVADHIDHVVALVGVEHVGLGSDYDGVGPTTPEGLRDVSAYPNLFRVLLERGYSEEDVRKIAGGNLLRVWRAVERVAAESAGTAPAG